MILVAVLLVAAQGCSLQIIALRTVQGLFDNTVDALMRETDLRFAEAAMAGNMKLLEGALATDTANVKYLSIAAMGFASYAMIYAADDPQRALDFFGRARTYGLRGLQLRGIPPAAFAADAETMSAALGKLGASDVPLAFWTANAWGNVLNLRQDDPDELAALPTVVAMMQWVHDTEPGYYYGGASLYFGVYYGSLPPAFGGKPELSRAAFEEAVAFGGGKFLMTDVYYARTYAVEVQDSALFRSLLQRVVDAPAGLLPEQALANAAAKESAARLLSDADTFF